MQELKNLLALRHFPGTLLFTLEPLLDTTAMKMPSQEAKIAHFHYGEKTRLRYGPIYCVFSSFLGNYLRLQLCFRWKYVCIQVHTYSYTYISNNL